MKIIYEYFRSVMFIPPGVDESYIPAFVDIDGDLYELKKWKFWKRPSDNVSGYKLLKVPKINEDR